MTFASEFFTSEFPIMHQERVETIIGRLKDGQPSPRPTGKKSNTTVFAFTYDDGVILAGDRRMTEGYYEIASDSAVKVKQLSKFSAIACAGYCNIIRYLEDNMEAACTIFRERYQKELSPDGQANRLRNLMEGWWYFYVFYWYWYIGVPILAAYDLEMGRPRIFSFAEDGFYFEPPFLVGTGCGFEVVRGLIVDHWREDLDADSAITLAVRAMIHSGVASHGVSDARIVPPRAALIDKEGFRWVPERLIVKKRNELLKEIRGIQCLLH